MTALFSRDFIRAGWALLLFLSACDKGTVYDKAPGVLVRITGQPPLTACIYQLQKLRCRSSTVN